MSSSVPRVVAHRGASAEAPENTMPAFELAVELGAGGIECDVRLTADGVPVVLHDETVDRTTDGSGRVRKMALEEVRSLDAGAGRGRRFAGTRIPTLEEVLDRFAGEAWIDLELKPSDKDPRPVVEAVADLLDGAEAGGGVLVSSFRLDILEAARDRLPDVPQALLLPEVPEGGGLARAAEGVEVLGVSWRSVGEDLADRCRELDVALFAWTVNGVDEARRLFEAGVDGVITDDPRRILRVSPA